MPIKLVYLATDPITAYRFMDGQLAEMRRRGYDVCVITSPGELLERVAAREQVTALGVPIAREMAPFRDLASLFLLVRALRRLRPDIVNAGTPKAGLLGVVAARLAGVPHVVYLLRGLRFEGASGVARLLLAASEHLSAGLADRVFCNSGSLRERFVSLGCARRDQIFVPAAGTSNGVDSALYAKTPQRVAWAAQERSRLGIGERSVVIGFVGRFTRDKGIAELVKAFQRLLDAHHDVHLLLVGDYDQTDPVGQATRETISSSPRIHLRGFVREPSAEYALMDVLAFPSYREGFPNVPLEAAAAEVPCVAFRATGTVDAVVEGETGILVPVGDVAAFAAALARYVMEPSLRYRHGTAARRRVERDFRREVVWDAIASEYRSLLDTGPRRASRGLRGFG